MAPKWNALNFVLIGLMALSAPLVADDRVGPYSAAPVDAPELAQLGEHAVGYRVISFTDPGRPDLAAIAAGRGPNVPRTLDLHIWYPARLAAGQTMEVTYTGLLPFPPGRIPEGAPTTFEFGGRAAADAAPESGEKYPLVVVSHGYGNWPTFLSYLTENLASKGYVAASIDHQDMALRNAGAAALSFGSVLINRTKDQRFAIDQLVALAGTDDPLGRIIDAQSIGLVGYSMGGYGVMASAGAGFDPSSTLFARLPKPLLGDILEGTAQAPHPNLKAVVAMAPWGGREPARAWTAQAIASIKIPLFFIAGDADDVSGFDGGIEWLFETASSADRHMLVYQNARHNIGGNPPPPLAAKYFALQDWFDEPVWRKDRIAAINQHFVTAFLDQHLKGESDKASYMDVSPAIAQQGVWPQQRGGNQDGVYSDGGEQGNSYWKGFQRRFALGLEMRRLAAQGRD
jgi:predicted dienelactone hydrolase